MDGLTGSVSSVKCILHEVEVRGFPLPVFRLTPGRGCCIPGTGPVFQPGELHGKPLKVSSWPCHCQFEGHKYKGVLLGIQSAIKYIRHTRVLGTLWLCG